MLNQLTEFRIQNGTLITSTDLVYFSKPPVYEVIRLLDGIPMFFDGHMERMRHSLEMVGEVQLLPKELVLKGIQTLVSVTNIRDNNIRIEIGRDKNNQFVWILFLVVSYYPDKIEYEKGVKTVTFEVERKDPHAKIYRTEFTEKINHLRKVNDAFEVILINHLGHVTEGSRSNLFFIKENKVYTAKTVDVLVGITRSKILEIIGELKLEIVEMDIAFTTLSDFEACFLTGTSIHLLPISRIDNIIYPSTQHPVMLRIFEALEKYIQNDIDQTRRIL